MNQLVDHSRPFVEESLRFSVNPHGAQGDFERGDAERHATATPQQGWLYSVNVLMGLIEIAMLSSRRIHDAPRARDPGMRCLAMGKTHGSDASESKVIRVMTPYDFFLLLLLLLLLL